VLRSPDHTESGKRIGGFSWTTAQKKAVEDDPRPADARSSARFYFLAGGSCTVTRAVLSEVMMSLPDAIQEKPHGPVTPQPSGQSITTDLPAPMVSTFSLEPRSTPMVISTLLLFLTVTANAGPAAAMARTAVTAAVTSFIASAAPLLLGSLCKLALTHVICKSITLHF